MDTVRPGRKGPDGRASDRVSGSIARTAGPSSRRAFVFAPSSHSSTVGYWSQMGSQKHRNPPGSARLQPEPMAERRPVLAAFKAQGPSMGGRRALGSGSCECTADPPAMALVFLF